VIRSPQPAPAAPGPSRSAPDEGRDLPCFPIGEVAARLGVSVQALRLYEQRGLILVRKGPGGQRQYSPADVDRLKCIRTAITEYKISIEGIRRLQALVPCWEHVGCPAERRRRCPAYLAPTAGCWTHAGRDAICRRRECRRCEVYLGSADCDGIKALIHGTTRASHSRQPRHKDHQA
jgi:MerR family transcriptional regulator/heat shock protein HspR